MAFTKINFNQIKYFYANFKNYAASGTYRAAVDSST